MKKNAIIVDLDGTLADITHRRRFVEGKKKDWKNFNKNIIQDDINRWCREIIKRMIHDHHVLLVSGRTDELKAETIDWLKKHEVPFTDLMMREEKDCRDEPSLSARSMNLRLNPSMLFSS